MKRLRLLILEDELPAAERLRSLLAEVRPEAEIIDVLDTGAEAVEYLNTHRHPDLIFSDIELADGLCFEVFARVKTEAPVIFTTAYDRYAIRAFETNAVDYLLKPIKKEDLDKALRKAENRIAAENVPMDYQALADLVESGKTKRRFLVKYGQKMFVIDPENIAYFHSENKATFATDYHGKLYPMDESLAALEKELDTRLFFRINRNMIVQLKSIGEMHPYSKGRIRLNLDPTYENKAHTIVSVERSADFRIWLRGK